MKKKILKKIIRAIIEAIIKALWFLSILLGIVAPKALLNRTKLIGLRLYRSGVSLDRLYVLTTISFEFTLLPHFINYYKHLGVKNFIVAVSNSIYPDLKERVASWARGVEGVKVVSTSERFNETGYEGDDKNEIRRDCIKPGDWIIPADLDEFIQYPDSLYNLMNKIYKSGATHIKGVFSDRLANGGILVKDTEDRSLFEQFPIEANVTQILPKACSTKITLCYGEVPLSIGAHIALDRSLSLPFINCVVHHFKWRASILGALHQRAEIYKREKIVYLDEVARTLAYLQKNGRIIPEEFGAKEGWKPDFSTVD